MKTDDPFNKKFKETADKWARYESTEKLLETASYVKDTLELAWAAAESVFEDQAKPEHALKILELFLSQTNK